jgi:hypothetical protein
LEGVWGDCEDALSLAHTEGALTATLCQWPGPRQSMHGTVDGVVVARLHGVPRSSSRGTHLVKAGHIAEREDLVCKAADLMRSLRIFKLL